LNFAIDAVVLFSLSEEQRRIPFSRNGVNVITGGSGTGKTAILDIIDYCFLASSHRISDSVINENVSWYGLQLFVDGKEFFLARKAPAENRVSSEYFFSQNVENYGIPTANIAEDDLRLILETSFGIDGRAIVPFGGRAIKANSKLSFRYFFLFNTISQDIITNSEVFFDRQTEDRYREALPRVFDLALGIDDLDNISARERREELSRELARLEKRSSHVSSREGLFESETRDIAKRAVSYGLMDGKVENPTSSDIRKMVARAYELPSTGWTQRYNQVSAQLFSLNKRIRSLESFTQEASMYKESLGGVEDSLKPMMAILQRSSELVKTDAFDDLISGLKADLSKVKEEVARRKPVDGQVGDLIKELKAEREQLTKQLEGLPPLPKALESEREKWIFIGETKGRLDTFEEVPKSEGRVTGRTPQDLQKEISGISVRDVDEERQGVLRTIEEIALDLRNEVKAVLENYAEYIPIFNYKSKKLQLKKPRSGLIENVGSSSNHMFMHLFHFLALQEVAILRKSKFVPTLLIIDQPSRPYYGDEDEIDDEESLSQSDTGKITSAFGLLDNFIARMNKDYNSSFQMIVFEHVPVSIFDKMKNVHLVEKFRDGVSLIPQSWIRSAKP
jgi:hypothetical protein